MFTVYILKSLHKNFYYIGHAEDPEKRLAQHNSKSNKSTKAYAPFIIVYKESFETKNLAYKREQQIKRYKHGEAFKKLIGI